MPIVAALPAIASVVGAGASIYGQSKAASAANRAADQNIALQREIYGKNEGYLSPYISRGNTASSALAGLLGIGGDAGASQSAFNNYLDSSGYKFQLGQGVDAINSQAATRGLLRSGSNLLKVSDYGQDTGRAYLGQYMGQLSGLGAQGLGAGSALAGVGANYAGAVGQQNTNAADATANAWLAGSSTFGNALGSLGTSLSSAFGRPSSSYGSGGSAPGGQGWGALAQFGQGW